MDDPKSLPPRDMAKMARRLARYLDELEASTGPRRRQGKLLSVPRTERFIEVVLRFFGRFPDREAARTFELQQRQHDVPASIRRIIETGSPDQDLFYAQWLDDRASVEQARQRHEPAAPGTSSGARAQYPASSAPEPQAPDEPQLDLQQENAK